MLLSKNDFESGLQQDAQVFRPAPFNPQVQVIQPGKGSLFGPPQALGGGFAPSQAGLTQEGKSKRDLLWE